ncbi:hypothetical protein ABVT39_025211, partial [Epinephelus coioides]
MDRIHNHRNSDTSISQAPLAPPGSQAQIISTLHLLPSPRGAAALYHGGWSWSTGELNSTQAEGALVGGGQGPLDNRYDILSLQDFPPADASSSSPVVPVGLHPAGRGPQQSRNRRLLVQPDPSPPSWSGGTTARRHTSMVRHVEVHNGRTFLPVSEAPVRTVRKRYLTSEVAANFIQILQSTPAEILPAPCDFIVDSFNNKLKSTLDSVAPLLIKTIRTKPTPPWRNLEIKQLKRYCRSAERRWRKSNLTVYYEILRQHLKTYNNAVKQARISHFKKLISDNKNNPKFLFSTIDILTNSNFNRSPKTTTNALCEDFADHFRSKINDIRSSLLSQQILTVDTPGSLLLPEETLESFALVDARTLGRVFSQNYLTPPVSPPPAVMVPPVLLLRREILDQRQAKKRGERQRDDNQNALLAYLVESDERAKAREERMMQHQEQSTTTLLVESMVSAIE